MSTNEDLVQQASRLTYLFQRVSELKSVPQELHQQESIVKSLQGSVAEYEAKVETLSKATRKEHGEYVKVKDATMSKFMHKVIGRGGAYEAQQEREKQEYMQALHDEHAAKEELEQLRQQLDQARATRDILSEKSGAFTTLSQELDRHLQRFNGSTPNFPEEDELERDYQRAFATHNDAHDRLQSERLALTKLREAERVLREASELVKEIQFNRARTHGSMPDDISHEILRHHVVDAKALLEEAQRASEEVQPIGHIPIESDVNFVLEILPKLKEQISAAELREESLAFLVEDTQRQMDNASTALNEYRKTILESIAQSILQNQSINEQPSEIQIAVEAESPVNLRVNTEARAPFSHQYITPTGSPTADHHSNLGSSPLQASPTHWGKKNPYAAAVQGGYEATTRSPPSREGSPNPFKQF